ncbi:hypothetical protein BZA77DRAFT_159293 [Pyronema omphalodes]|nr:hypothetical protein BZA77DRAFT_159293 [Pyronema omphalodes]
MLSRLRSVLTHSRLPLKVDSIATTQNAAKLYRVRFVNSRPPKYNFLKAVYYVAAGMVMCQIGIGVGRAMGLEGKPIFIPLGFAVQDEPRKFRRGDPEVAHFTQFGNDREKARKVRKIFEQKAVQVLQTSLPGNLGPHIKRIDSMLYFHYPQGPLPGYRQKGLRFVLNPPPPPAGNKEAGKESKTKMFECDYAERYMTAQQYLRHSTILYPQWMYNAIRSSVLDIYDQLTTPAGPDPEERINDLNDMVQYGVDLSQWCFTNLKDDLKKSRAQLPPPSGHVIIDGIVQVTSSQMVITVDLTGSFDPRNIEKSHVHKMSVRFAAKSKPVPRKQVMPRATESAESITRSVATKIEAEEAFSELEAATKVLNDSNQDLAKKFIAAQEVREKSKAMPEKLIEAKPSGKGKGKDVLEPTKTKEDESELSKSRRPNSATVPKDIENRPPPSDTPSPPQPRE